MPSLRVQGFNQLLRLYGRSLKVLDATGFVFSALVADAPPFDPVLTLGGDMREVSIIECITFPATAEVGTVFLDQGPVTKDSSDLGGWKWKCVKRQDSNADFVTRFWAVQIVPGVDT